MSQHIRINTNRMHNKGIRSFVIPDYVFRNNKCSEKIVVNVEIVSTDKNCGPTQAKIDGFIEGEDMLSYAEISAKCYEYNGMLCEYRMANRINILVGSLYDFVKLRQEYVPSNLTDEIWNYCQKFVSWNDENNPDGIKYAFVDDFIFSNTIHNTLQGCEPYKKYTNFLNRFIGEYDNMSHNEKRFCYLALKFMLNNMYFIAKTCIAEKDFIMPFKRGGIIKYGRLEEDEPLLLDNDFFKKYSNNFVD